MLIAQNASPLRTLSVDKMRLNYPLTFRLIDCKNAEACKHIHAHVFDRFIKCIVPLADEFLPLVHRCRLYNL